MSRLGFVDTVDIDLPRAELAAEVHNERYFEEGNSLPDFYYEEGTRQEFL